MSKKKLFKISIITGIGLIIILIALFFKPFTVKNVDVYFEVSLDGENSDYIQLYYLSDKNEAFTEENSVAYPVVAGEKQAISFSLNNMERFRVDFGNLGAACTIENVTFKMNSHTIPWGTSDWEAMSICYGIEEMKFIDGITYITPSGIDPYIVWDVDELQVEERFSQELSTNNMLVKGITVFVLLVILFVVIKKFEFFVEFPTEIWRSRGILWQLSKNDFKTRFAGSYLGIVWAFVQPIVTVVVYWFVFEKGLRSGAVSNVPFVLFLISGLVPWFFFSDALNGGTNALLEYQYLVKKVVFQINILPLVKVISNFFVHAVFVAFAVVLFISYGYYPNLYTLQIFYYSFCAFVLVLGLCYATSALVGFFRDLTQIIGIVLQIGMWMTPIMWSMETMDIPEGLKIIFKANPMYYIVSGYRDALINKVWFWENAGLTIYFWIITVIILGGGMVIFKRLKPHFADVL